MLSGLLFNYLTTVGDNPLETIDTSVCPLKIEVQVHTDGPLLFHHHFTNKIRQDNFRMITI